jgi:hypothetical protein
MGSATRQSINDRFVEKFNDLYVKAKGLNGSCIISQGLVEGDCGDRIFYGLKLSIGDKVVDVILPDVVFDPESNYDNELNIDGEEFDAMISYVYDCDEEGN